MTQPIWKLFSSTDCERIFIDTTGVYSPEMEYADCIKEEDFKLETEAVYYLYKVCLDKYLLNEEGRLVNEYNHEPWFEDTKHKNPSICINAEKSSYCSVCAQWVSFNLKDAARSCGLDPNELRRMFCSDDVSELAYAYTTIYSSHGWNNGDSYPIELTETELNKRWK